MSTVIIVIWRLIMTTSEQIRVLCVRSGVSLSELARRINQTPQNFSVMLRAPHPDLLRSGWLLPLSAPMRYPSCCCRSTSSRPIISRRSWSRRQRSLFLWHGDLSSAAFWSWFFLRWSTPMRSGLRCQSRSCWSCFTPLRWSANTQGLCREVPLMQIPAIESNAPSLIWSCSLNRPPCTQRLPCGMGTCSNLFVPW